ncbi:MAG: sialate O-acetylesterase [Parvibaculales bacterium]
MRFFLSLIFFCLILALPIKAEEYKLYLLAGQSNMVGLGKNEDLPRAYKGKINNVMIFHGTTGVDNMPYNPKKFRAGQGKWSKLREGHGGGFSSNGKSNIYVKRFGAELSFGKTIAELNPNSKIAIIKYARGATALYNTKERNNWAEDFEGLNQYDYALDTIRNAFAISDIDGDGERDTLIPSGIIWMQGEADSRWVESSNAYKDNLQRLMNALRAALRLDDVPVVIGKTSNAITKRGKPKLAYGHIVQEKQKEFAENDVCAHLVSEIDDYKMLPDNLHYTSKSYLRMGEDFAKAVHRLEKKCK